MKEKALSIRKATAEDFEAVYPIFEEIVGAGETYPYVRDTSYEEAYHIWMEVPRETFVAEVEGEIVGTYYLKPNQPGQGAHVCNCGYMVAPHVRGGGIAAKMCLHSQERAVALGYRSMQFNLVVSTNTTAVSLWQRMGFETIGRLPEAFAHPGLGYVDALVMYKVLAQSNIQEKESVCPIFLRLSFTAPSGIIGWWRCYFFHCLCFMVWVCGFGEKVLTEKRMGCLWLVSAIWLLEVVVRLLL